MNRHDHEPKEREMARGWMFLVVIVSIVVVAGGVLLVAL